MTDLKFEIGQWVMTGNGYGQILYIRPYFVEDYENYRKGRKNGEFVRFIYICKILCGLDGKLKKTKRIIIDTSISTIDKKGMKFLEEIKHNQKDEYLKYIVYDEKNNLVRQLFLNYNLDTLDFDIDLIENQFYELVNNLESSFTYKEFAKQFKEFDFPFKLENLIGYGCSHGEKGSIMLRFDSQLYKTKEKEAIFDDVRIFFPKNLKK
ncbi:hypothetical protein [Flavobacterium branchiophilum]|uniref:Uncharacterized protein n=1 Tax=Flavobacterium branchiophilum TaxID=55197 RepID=A0A2H3KTE2_9FLAO|nr:hypothetical protein [Flavobacterium branchiophilum]PDS23083.1 hypothetical protein B0A77_11745 [Flavobacterium branchiophilum]